MKNTYLAVKVTLSTFTCEKYSFKINLKAQSVRCSCIKW